LEHRLLWPVETNKSTLFGGSATTNKKVTRFDNPSWLWGIKKDTNDVEEMIQEKNTLILSIND